MRQLCVHAPLARCLWLSFDYVASLRRVMLRCSGAKCPAQAISVRSCLKHMGLTTSTVPLAAARASSNQVGTACMTAHLLYASNMTCTSTTCEQSAAVHMCKHDGKCAISKKFPAGNWVALLHTCHGSTVCRHAALQQQMAHLQRQCRASAACPHYRL